MAIDEEGFVIDASSHGEDAAPVRDEPALDSLPEPAPSGDDVAPDATTGVEDTAPESPTDDVDSDPVEVATSPDDGAPDAGTSLTSTLDGLRTAVEQFHDRSRAHEDVIARMQERIETLQADQVRALLGPVVNELAALLADFSEAANLDYATQGLDRVSQEFAFLGTRIENALDLLGVSSVDAHPGQPFDSRVHQAVRQIPTTDVALDKTIATVQRQGFTFASAAKPALYARVTVYAHDPAAVSAPAEAPAERPNPAPVAPEAAPMPDVVPVVISEGASVDAASSFAPLPAPDQN